MVKKFVFVLSRMNKDSFHCDNDNCDNEIIDNKDSLASQFLQLEAKQNALHELLKHYKNHITAHYRSKKWDKFKKFGNEFELVFTSCTGYPSISRYKPISRSFFKLWEVLYDYHNVMGLDCPSQKTCLFLAEGPGGFVEAFEYYRRRIKTSYNSSKDAFKDKDGECQDILFGMTLKSRDKNIPQWKVNVGKSHLNMLYGKDGTGNICNIDNIDATVKAIGENSTHLVTADGGFDFSADFNNQEGISFNLILAEAYCALRTQRNGGHFILKIYDIFNESTIYLLYMLTLFYSEVHVVKPLSSRPANSEKYIVCLSHQPRNESQQKCLDHMRECIRTQGGNSLFCRNLEHCVPVKFLEVVYEYNCWYIMRQIVSISKTIAFIYICDKNSDILKKNIKIQIENAIRWCHKYKITICIETVKNYIRNHS